MTHAANVAVIIGSLRKASFSRRLATALIDRAPPDLSARIVEIGSLPLYNEDFDNEPPTAWTEFRDALRASDAVLFVTPEYNRSVPGALKNAIDVGSRPPGQSVWDGLPTGVVSLTQYSLGGFGGNLALRQAFIFLNMPVMQQPEAYVSGAAELFAEDGTVRRTETDEFLRFYMERFADWVERFRRPRRTSRAA